MHEGGHAAREIKVIACIFSLSPTQPHTHVTRGCMRPTCPPTCSGNPPTPPSQTLSLSPTCEVLLCPAGQGCRGINVSNNSFALQMPLDLEITSQDLVLRKLLLLRCEHCGIPAKKLLELLELLRFWPFRCCIPLLSARLS